MHVVGFSSFEYQGRHEIWAGVRGFQTSMCHKRLHPTFVFFPNFGHLFENVGKCKFFEKKKTPKFAVNIPLFCRFQVIAGLAPLWLVSPQYLTFASYCWKKQHTFTLARSIPLFCSVHNPEVQPAQGTSLFGGRRPPSRYRGQNSPRIDARPAQGTLGHLVR